MFDGFAEFTLTEFILGFDQLFIGFVNLFLAIGLRTEGRCLVDAGLSQPFSKFNQVIDEGRDIDLVNLWKITLMN